MTKNFRGLPLQSRIGESFLSKTELLETTREKDIFDCMYINLCVKKGTIIKIAQIYGFGKNISNTDEG